jgi:16S rRNA (cytosine967-C5)-methyltransferase
MSATPGRRIAFEVLLRVEAGGAYASRALDAALARAGAVDPREAGLATELVYGTLRRALALDAALAPHSRRPLGTLDAPARVALRLGAYQLLHLRTPAHAAVGETVALAKGVEHGRAAGYVNAVLRALARSPSPPAPPLLAADPAAHVAAAEALPRWLAGEWVDWLGPEEALALARAMNSPAPLCLRAPARDALLARLRGAGLAAAPAPRSQDGIVLSAGSVADVARAAGGLAFQVQDEAAQLVTLYAAGELRGRTARVLDACAAPGGKAFHLAELLGPGSEVVAVELHPRKADELAREARRRGLAVRVVCADASRAVPGLA